MLTRLHAKGPESRRAFSLAVLTFALCLQPDLGWCAAGKAPLDTAAVMAPLEIRSREEKQAFERLLSEAKSAGANGVSVDVWWGKVEKNSDERFDWSYYDEVFGRIRERGLKIAPIMSFHKCGGGPGDDCDIPLPAWLYSQFAAIGISDRDLKYDSETGRVQDDAVAPWATATPAVLDQFREFMRAFGVRYAPNARDFAELNISLGPTGELRYPAYNGADGWSYPNRGNFQGYSDLAQSHFRSWALAKFGGLAGVNHRWRTSLGSPTEIRVPGGHLPDGSGLRAESFVRDNDYMDTQYGRDFIDWYNESLVDHGRRLLVAANEAFGDAFESIPLGMKIPGVHWQMMPCADHPRIAEITAGLVQTTLNLSPDASARPDVHGYKRILDMIADVKAQTGRDVVLHFTAAEMDNDPACGEGNSMANALVFWISEGAQDRHIKHKGENALACVNQPRDDRTWEMIRNVYSNAPYTGFTLLRLVETGCNPWGTDNGAYASFVKDYDGQPNKPDVRVHLAEWRFCPEAQGCRYNLQAWNGLNGSFPLHYEGSANGRQWWTGTVANAPDVFSFTFNNAYSWEGGPDQFDRGYRRAVHGNEIYVLGRGDTNVYTNRQ